MTTYASPRPRSTLKWGNIGSARLIARPARRGRTLVRELVLRDGSTVLLRQIGAADGPLLLDGFGRLSAESRQARFLIRKDELTDAEVRYFTDVDHHDHEAIVALSAADGRGVGVARFVRAVDDDQAAEVAVTVVDDWQRRGLGAVLLRQLLERALQEGIRRFTALIDDSNTAMLGLLRSLGVQPRVLDREFGATEYSIRIDEAPERSTFAQPHVQQRVRRPATSGGQTRAADGA
jgi:GNAT superfamily N-acetyltransferase